MKKIFLILFIVFPLNLYSYFDYNCDNETIFFVNELKLKQVDLSSFYCDFWKNNEYFYSNNNWVKVWDFIKYDKETKSLLIIDNSQKINYLKRLKVDLENVKNDVKTKETIKDLYIKNYRDYENKLSQLFKKYIFSKSEIIYIKSQIEKQPYKIFENTYSQRLLMNWRIISREEWWADETYSKRDVYMKWCEDWSCYTGPVASTTIKDNYIKYFQDQDLKDKKVKTFTDWRDALSYYPVDRIIIHHTAWGYKATKEEWLAYMKAVQKYHALTLRWSDIWYHYLIDWEGNIYEWRAWWKYVLWAHVATHNYGSIWISLMSDWEYSEEMLKSLQDLVVYLWKEYDLDLTKKTTVRNNELTWYWDWWALIAHKELDSRKPKDPDINMDEFRWKIIARIKYENFLANKTK